MNKQIPHAAATPTEISNEKSAYRKGSSGFSRHSPMHSSIISLGQSHCRVGRQPRNPPSVNDGELPRLRSGRKADPSNNDNPKVPGRIAR